MNSTKKALIAAAIAVIFAAGLIFWQVKARKTGPVELTAEDMAILAEDQPAPVRQRLATDESARKEFALEIRRLLAVAEEAQAHGVDKKADLKRQLEFQKAQTIARYYFQEQGENSPDISDREVNDYFSQPLNKHKFDLLLADAKAADPAMAAQEIPEDRLEMLKQRVGRIYLAEQKGIEQGLDKKPAVKLQVLLQNARVVAQTYAMQNLEQKMKASDEEIDKYLAEHPEVDTDKANRAKAEEVLKRLRAGEDFAKLAQEFGSDGTREKGGDLGWMPENRLDPTFVKAANQLKPGEISEVVQTSFGFHIIKLEGKKTETVDGKPQEMIHTRHILFRDIESNPFGPPQSPRDKARAAIEKEKAEKVLEDIVARSHVKVPDSYSVKPPEQEPAQNLPPSFAPPAGEPEAKPAASPAKPAPKSQAKPRQ